MVFVVRPWPPSCSLQSSASSVSNRWNCRGWTQEPAYRRGHDGCSQATRTRRRTILIEEVPKLSQSPETKKQKKKRSNRAAHPTLAGLTSCLAAGIAQGRCREINRQANARRSGRKVSILPCFVNDAERLFCQLNDANGGTEGCCSVE